MLQILPNSNINDIDTSILLHGTTHGRDFQNTSSFLLTLHLLSAMLASHNALLQNIGAATPVNKSTCHTYYSHYQRPVTQPEWLSRNVNIFVGAELRLGYDNLNQTN